MARFNRADVKKADIPVLGKDSVDSKKTDDGTSIKINPYRKIKGMHGSTCTVRKKMAAVHFTTIPCEPN